MRRTFLWIGFVVCTLVVFPTIGLCQGLLPGLPAMSLANGDDSVVGSFYVGYGQNSITFGAGQDSPLYFFFGIFSYEGTDFRCTTRDLALGGSVDVSPSFSVPGVPWQLGYVGSFWYVFPVSTTSASEDYRRTSLFPGTLPGTGGWNASTTRWYAEALISSQITPVLETLCGLRYESISTTFTNPTLTGVSFPVPPWFIPFFHTPEDEAEVSGAGLIPIVGLRLRYNGSSSDITVQVVGWPWLQHAALEYNEPLGVYDERIESTNRIVSGFLVDAQADYTRRLAGFGEIGAFLRLRALHTKFRADVDQFTIPDPILPIMATGGGKGDGYSRINTIIVGGKATIPFRIPSL